MIACSIRATLIDPLLNLTNWLQFLILVGGQITILIGCIILLSSFLGVIRMLCP